MNNKSKSKTNASWANKLLPYCDHPDTYPKDIVLHYDDTLVTIRDAYAKAKHHYLVMPRNHIQSLAQITPAHRSLLVSMKAEADRVAQRFHSNASTSSSSGIEKHNNTVRIGFHAVPSMAQLHLHVISNDFISDALKTKRHYLSFTTPFFKPFDDVLAMLDSHGKIQFNEKMEEERLKGVLKCHLCETVLTNMPTLKKHLLTHDKRV